MPLYAILKLEFWKWGNYIILPVPSNNYSFKRLQMLASTYVIIIEEKLSKYEENNDGWKNGIFKYVECCYHLKAVIYLELAYNEILCDRRNSNSSNPHAQ